MRTILLSMTAAALTTVLSGQSATVNSGKITYEEKVKLEIKLEGDAAHLAQNFPKERKSEKLLSFSDGVSLYEDGAADVEDEMVTHQGEGGVRVKMMVAGGGNKLFTDLKNNQVIEQRDFMNRMFLVEKKIPADEWKVTGNQKKIMGYDCYEAVKQDTGKKRTIAWFAPAITVKGGPAGICNLPGMVLEADFNNGSRVYTTKSVELIAAKDMKIEKPREGKKVTEEEFNAIVDEKMKEMGIERGTQGGGDQVRIVIRH